MSYEIWKNFFTRLLLYQAHSHYNGYTLDNTISCLIIIIIFCTKDMTLTETYINCFSPLYNIKKSPISAHLLTIIKRHFVLALTLHFRRKQLPNMVHSSPCKSPTSYLRIRHQAKSMAWPAGLVRCTLLVRGRTRKRDTAT